MSQDAGSDREWGKWWNLFGSTAGLVISLIALAVTWAEHDEAKVLNRVSHRPNLHMAFRFGSGVGYAIELQNNGAGIAKILSFEGHLDSHDFDLAKMEGLTSLLTQIGVEKEANRSQVSVGTMLSPDSTVVLFDLPGTWVNSKLVSAPKELQAMVNTPARLKFTIRYADIFGDICTFESGSQEKNSCPKLDELLQE